MEERNPRKRGRRRRRAQGIRSLIFLMMTVSVLTLVCFLAVRGTAREVFRRDNSSVELSWRETAVSGGKSEEEQADSWQDMPWYLMLVNRWNPIPQDYQAELADVPGGEAGVMPHRNDGRGLARVLRRPDEEGLCDERYGLVRQRHGIVFHAGDRRAADVRPVFEFQKILFCHNPPYAPRFVRALFSL